MDISYEFTADDWAAMQKDYMINLPAFKRTKMLSALIGPIVSLILMGLIYIKGDYNNFFLAMAVAISIGWIFIYPHRFEKTVIANARKKYEKSRGEAKPEIHKVKLGDDEIIVRTKSREIKTGWDKFTAFRENDEHIFLYTGSATALVIPKKKIVGGSSQAKDGENGNVAEAALTFIREKAKRMNNGAH